MNIVRIAAFSDNGSGGNPAGVFPLVLNEASISVEGSVTDGRFFAALQSPHTTSEALEVVGAIGIESVFIYSG